MSFTLRKKKKRHTMRRWSPLCKGDEMVTMVLFPPSRKGKGHGQIKPLLEEEDLVVMIILHPVG